MTKPAGWKPFNEWRHYEGLAPELEWELRKWRPGPMDRRAFRQAFYFAAWVHHELQCQPPANQNKRWHEPWPTRVDFKREWPRLAHELIHGSEMIRNEAAGHSHLPAVPYRLLDPPREDAHWSERYEAELIAHPRIGVRMMRPDAIHALMRLARLTPDEKSVMQMHLNGNSNESIARTLGCQNRSVWIRLQRGKAKLQNLTLRQEVAA